MAKIIYSQNAPGKDLFFVAHFDDLWYCSEFEW